jgi:hypothetical protein
MGTRQDDPLGGALFILTHLKVLCSITNHFFSCLFLSIVDDIHIIGSFQLYLHMNIFRLNFMR